MPHQLLATVALAVLGAAFAHVPHFPTEAGPIAVANPAVSKAYYLQGAPGAAQVFQVEPVARSIPVQVLVLDDDAGRAARFLAQVDCGAGVAPVRVVDVPFYEPFSRLHHRIVAAGALGPSPGICVVEVLQTGGVGVPYTVSIGDEERFGIGDVLGLIDLPRRMARWGAGGR